MTPTKIICHHSGGTDANPLQESSNYTVLQCNQDHKVRFDFVSSLGWYVGYQYFIDKTGTITQCRKDDEEGAHTIGQNNSSIGICLAGNFDVTLPTPPQIKSLTLLIQKKMKEWDIDGSQVFPHRKFARKTCYGKRLSDTWAMELISPVSSSNLNENAKIQEKISFIRQLIENLKNLIK